jgi:seryl-tRNA synthetase
MSELKTAATEQLAYLDELVDARLLTRTGVHGVYARGPEFERVRLAFDALVTRTAAPEAPEALHFPPIFPREQLETNGYLGSFPHLAGTVFGFDGDDEQAAAQLERATRHEDWSGFQEMTDMVLPPAACYPIYPTVARRGPLPEGGLTFDTGDAYVFRHEPSDEPARMQIFHMREIVRIGERNVVLAWRGA